MLYQRRRRWVDVVEMLYNCLVFAEHVLHHLNMLLLETLQRHAAFPEEFSTF